MIVRIGRTMALVKELGLDENTLFIFSSDNGPLHGTHEGLAGTDANFFNSAGGLRDGSEPERLHAQRLFGPALPQPVSVDLGRAAGGHHRRCAAARAD